MNTLIIILLFGSLLLLSFLLIANPVSVNKKANFWFGLVMLFWSTFWLEEIFAIISLDFQSNLFWLPIRFFQFSTPVVFYYSITFYANPNFRCRKKDFIHFIIPVILFVVLIVNQFYSDNANLPHVLNALVIIQAFYFIIISYIKIQKH